MRRLSVILIALLIFFARFTPAAAQPEEYEATLTACYIGSTVYYSFSSSGITQGSQDLFFVEVKTSDRTFDSDGFPINYGGTTSGAGAINFTGSLEYVLLYATSGNGEVVSEVQPVPPCIPNYGFFPECPNPLPNLSAVAVTVRQPAFGIPGGSQAQTFGAGIFLHDGPNPGTNYTVIKTALYNGKLWYGLYLGGCTPVWIAADAPGVTLLAPIPPSGLPQS